MTANTPASLVPEETNVGATSSASENGLLLLATAPDTLWRHGRDQRTRLAILRRMGALGWSIGKRTRYASCGSAAWVHEHAERPGSYLVSANVCHDRWCPACQRARARRLAAAVERKMSTCIPRFITLTLKTNREPLTESLDKLYECFRRLRATPLWKTHVRGGYAALEITYNRERRTWHPHFHIVAEGTYLKQSALSAEWHYITQTSHVVDIRAVKRVRDLARYVAKYVSKPIDLDEASAPAVMDEAMAALHGRRLAMTIGTWRGTPLLEAPEPPPRGRCIGAVADLIKQAAAGSATARGVLDSICRDGSAEDLIWTRGPEKLPPCTLIDST